MAEGDDQGDGETRSGLVFGASAYLLWGGFPLYFPLLEPAGTAEILAQRMAWSLVVMLIILRFTRGLGRARAVLGNPRQRRLLVAAALVITINWGTYIYGVNSGHVVETSLGYFINPLFTILLGVLVLGERLRPMQWTAVGIGTVAILVIAVDYGRPPWIALILATTFGLYGFFKKRAAAGAAESMTIETGALFVPAVITLGVVAARGDLVFGTHGVGTTVLLATTGIVTAVPLLMFAASTRRLPLSVVGLLQYLAPVLQFSVGVGIRHEPLPTAELIGFALVWVALIVLTLDGLRAQRRPSPVTDSVEALAA
jgi:chloramphenicol-sensitive protein RarD